MEENFRILRNDSQMTDKYKDASAQRTFPCYNSSSSTIATASTSTPTVYTHIVST